MTAATATATTSSLSSSSSSSSWATKLETRLTKLPDTASAESIQTLGNWICFHRSRHTSTIVSTLTSQLLRHKALPHTKQLLMWKVVNAVLMFQQATPPSTTSDSGSHHTSSRTYREKRTEQQLELRVAVGESLPSVLEELGPSVPDEALEQMLEEWDDANVFESPTLVGQILRIFKDRNNKDKNVSDGLSSTTPDLAAEVTGESTTTLADMTVTAEAIKEEEPSASANKNDDGGVIVKEAGTASYNSNQTSPSASPSQPLAADVTPTSKSKKEEDDDDNKVEKDEVVAPTTSSADTSTPTAAEASTTSSSQTQTYDFDKKGVPEGHVDPKEFLEPCKAISTLQIARDIRTNSAVERSGQINALPADIWKTCQDMLSSDAFASSNGGADGGSSSDERPLLDDETLDDYSKRIPSNLLDLDIDEELSSLETYKEIVERQTKAREKLIFLLLKSRCAFGAQQAAKKFFEMCDPAIIDKLNKRKQVLGDALELEGADTSQIEQEFQKLSPTAAGGNSSSAKRRKANNGTPRTEDLPPFEWYTAEAVKKE